MGTDSTRHHHDTPRKTAIGLGDPVLVRLTNGLFHTLLLADDAIYDEAETIRLQNVRWLRAPRGLKNLLPLKRKSATGHLAELRLTKSKDYVATVIADQPCIRVASAEPAFKWVPLTHDKFMELCASSPAGFARAAQKLSLSARQPRSKTRLHYSTSAALIQLAFLARSPKRIIRSLAYAVASMPGRDR